MRRQISTTVPPALPRPPPGRSLGHRAPLLWLALPFAAGLALAHAGLALPTIAALGVAAGMAEGLVPDSPEGEQAMSIVTSSIDAGGALVSACEQLRDDADSFQGWLTVAVAAVKAVLGIIRAAGVDIPGAVDQSVRELERLLEQRAEAPPIARVPPYEPAYFD